MLELLFSWAIVGNVKIIHDFMFCVWKDADVTLCDKIVIWCKLKRKIYKIYVSIERKWRFFDLYLNKERIKSQLMAKNKKIFYSTMI